MLSKLSAFAVLAVLATPCALSYLVDLCEEFLELVLRGPEAHGPHDLPEVVSGQEVHLLGVEQVETNLGGNSKMEISLFILVKLDVPLMYLTKQILPTVHFLTCYFNDNDTIT